tara:strand:+ start:5266 stop:5460 length:195 start_codon:yes stop_codon:yes gene_type:complete
MARFGEPLNPEAVKWGQDVFGQPFHDNWWQTETGGIMIANYAAGRQTGVNEKALAGDSGRDCSG